MDIDGDGKSDILLGGNLYGAKPEAGRYDASFGTVLKGDGKGEFTPILAAKSGLKVDGEVRDIITLRGKGGDLIVVSRNNNGVVTYKSNRP